MLPNTCKSTYDCENDFIDSHIGSRTPIQTPLPDSVQTQLATDYEALFKLFLKHRDKVTRVTFWGVNDGDSWLNNWPICGRTSYPLLFDRKDQPKPTFYAVIKTAKLGLSAVFARSSIPDAVLHHAAGTLGVYWQLSALRKAPFALGKSTRTDVQFNKMPLKIIQDLFHVCVK